MIQGIARALPKLYLSDNANSPLKFQIPSSNPEMILAPNEHIVFYADDNVEQGDFHTNFKLDNNGEELLLSYLDFSLEPVNIDQIEFGAIPLNSSFGRISDAQEEWITFDISTPNATNEILTNVDSEAAEALNILVYPNPSADKINFSIEGLNQSKISQIRFLSAEGKESLSLENPNQLNGIDISHLPSGVYFIELTLNETDSKSRIKFIKL